MKRCSGGSKRRSAAPWLAAWGLCLVCGMISPASSQVSDVLDDPLALRRVASEAPDVSLTVHHEATGETRMITGRYLLQGSQEMYLRSATMATVLKASRFWQSAVRRLDLKIGERTYRLTGGSRLVVTDDGEVLLPVPVLDHAGDLWLPLILLEQVIGPQIRERMVWDQDLGRLSLGSVDFNINSLKVEILGRTTLVRIACDKPLSYRTGSPTRGVIELKIYAGRVNTAAVGMTSRRGLALSARSRQMRDDVVITVVVDDLVGRYRTYTEDDGAQIVLVLEEEQVDVMPDPVPHGHAEVNIDTGPVDVTHQLEIRTVVIDPGHGGHEVGAVGRQGILEKDVNMAVARELRRFLERESNLEVVLTRDRDEYLELGDRAEIANTADGDLFISLHCNSWFNDGAHGLETYFLSPARTEWARNVEAAENQAGMTEPGDVEFIVWELVQNRFISSSSRLAELVQESICNDVDTLNRGVRQAGFRVLVGAYMPAVLIEMGFLSHAREEQRLGERSYQRELARAIGRSILEFREITASMSLPAADGSQGSGIQEDQKERAR